ncbi:phosphoenolpyruvate--protein phosphotransferase [bacterium 210820-DFI.6.37]|nr:phosphoenolpyruvate--protein phosphotransferase [bacterium 210820-DFI.6.37]
MIGVRIMLKGIPVSEGIGIGTVYIVKEPELARGEKATGNPEKEKERFQSAVREFCRKTEETARALERSIKAKDAEIIRGHIQMLRDPYMQAQIEEQIQKGSCAEEACGEIFGQYIEMFSQTGDELVAQRAADVRDIKKRLLMILMGKEELTLQAIPEGSILVTEELTPSMAAELDQNRVRGIVTEKGSKTSHVAILAKSLGIPAVLSAEQAVTRLKQGEMAALDGSEGIVLSPLSERQKQEFQRRREAYERRKVLLSGFTGRKTETADGWEKHIFCNIGTPEEAVSAAERDGEGIGLFRTEFLFMDKTEAPSEEEQFTAYKKAAELFKGKPVIIRTLDVGGDKGIPYLNMEKEENPFLGFRAVRYCLARQELYKTQLRAVLRASAFGLVRVMVPLVTGVEELRAVKSKIKTIMEELDQAGVPYDKELRVGVMMETPAASLMADVLAKESDFFSIGTNDLIQYTMAADRGNPQVAYLNRPYAPAVLRSVRHIIESGRAAGIPVGMCGEAAADPLLTPLLLAFGLDEFSVSPSSVLSARYNISKWTIPKAKTAMEKAMLLETADEIEAYLKQLQKENTKEE